MLYTAATVYEDIESSTVVDLGVGCGVLTCAAGMLSSAVNIGVDIDPDALAQAQSNFELFELDVDLVNADIPEWILGSSDIDAIQDQSQSLPSRCRLKADTVLMNPPFGTKNNKGIDMQFLRAAAAVAENAIYSLHKSSTRDFILKKAESWGLKGEVVAEMRYNIDASYKFHKKKSVDIEVDFLRFQVQ
eukprot:jgi/Hompol1/3078/HPOL_001553-RA